MSVLDTHEAHRAIRRHVAVGTAIQRDRKGRERFYTGHYFVCPRCTWVSRVMRSVIGAERRGELHALACPDEQSEARPVSLV